MDRSSTPASSPATTYIQADAHTFRDLVQRLTGATGDAAAASPALAPRRQSFKLQERRGAPTVRNLEIRLGVASLRSPRSPRFPISSPVSPLGSGTLFSPAAGGEEERAIVEKGFFLHPSPRGGKRPPELLPLFPVSSPESQGRREEM